MNAQTDRLTAGRQLRAFDAEKLLARSGGDSVAGLWGRLADRMHAIPLGQMSELDYDRICPGDSARIFTLAHDAMDRRVSLLGSRVMQLGTPIDWHTDFKTGKTWPVTFMRDINYTNLGCPSDVKIPWELSRLQWLIPVGQAYLLTRDDRYARAAREVLEDWMAANPYAHGVNWACTMEAAMRIISWTWFFHVFCKSRAWSEPGFQFEFLRNLFLHGQFTERYLERSDVNGNHFTADATGLVFAGLFFGSGAAPKRWAQTGWDMLCRELPRQVTADGVDFEASVAYHRLVLELFFLAARYREAHGQSVADDYRARLIQMARFTMAYVRPDGSSPLVGDADDARVLPFGGQEVGDHRYLVGLIGAHWNVQELTERFDGPRAELVWTLGRRAAMTLPGEGVHPEPVASAAFPDGGFYVMRNDRDHVFIDCGPVGQAGRGGHGHNDCLSFEAVLDGVRLISDCGAYVYTADARARNRFRSTASHNTPQVDGEEVNRFVSWDYLWSLHDDARPEVNRWETGPERDIFVGTHSGYHRLADPVSPVRAIILEHATRTLTISDVIDGAGDHVVVVPLHLAPGVDARIVSAGELRLTANGKEFTLRWASPEDWTLAIGDAAVSPSYGVAVAARRLVWQHSGTLPATLTMSVTPRLARALPDVDALTTVAV